MIIDLTHAGTDDFVRFVFDHPTVDEGEPEWYFTEDFEVLYEAHRQVRLLTELFATSARWRARFTDAQIEQGLWFVFNRAEPYVTELLWNNEVPWAERRACIDAIFTLYADLFPICPVATIDYMIPDLLADGYDFGTRHPDANPEDRQVQEALMALFARLLDQPQPAAQYAGLHGLGHLEHPRGPALIDDYLVRHADITASLREYALQARAGDVL
jgi:hypothetical protein